MLEETSRVLETAPAWMTEVIHEAMADWIKIVQVQALNHCGVALGLGCFYLEGGGIFCRRLADGGVEAIDSVAIGLYELSQIYPQCKVMELFREGLDLSWEAM
jgi:hypothetical protein